MVKLEGLTREEIEERNNYRKWKEKIIEGVKNEKKFIDITIKLFGKSIVYPVKNIEDFSPPSWGEFCKLYPSLKQTREAIAEKYYCSPISIHSRELDLKGRDNIPISISPRNEYLHENKIYVHHPEYLDKAIQLARAYEEGGLGECTVKKQYEE